MLRRFDLVTRRLGAGALCFVVGCASGPTDDALTDQEPATSSVVVSFQNGVAPSAAYVGTTDTTILQSRPTTADGSDASLRADFDYPDSTKERAESLLRFDLSSVPPTGKVSAVALTVNVTNRTTGDGYLLYPLSRSWNAAQATWDAPASGASWSSPGARGSSDRGTTALATLAPSATGTVTVTLNAAGVAEVQKWVATPSTNFGFVLDTTDDYDGLLIDSSNATTAAHRPKLTVSYTPAASGGTGGTGGSSGAGGSTGAFVHPGILVSAPQIAYVKNHITSEPWATQIGKAKSSSFGSLSHKASPVAVMQCGNGQSTIDVGCDASRADMIAAYTQALIWAYTGDQRYATNAAAILDAWGSTLTEIAFSGGSDSTNNTDNGPLQAAWLGTFWPRAAEILRHTNSGWPAANAARFGQMLAKVVQPHALHQDGWKNIAGANWYLAMADAAINIGVYNDDHATFDAGVASWRDRVPANMYMARDGSAPKVPAGFAVNGGWPAGKLGSSWFGQTEFDARTSGITQESCRDFGHTQMGLASTVNAAETAYIQGIDLYGEQKARVMNSFEFIAGLLNGFSPAGGVLNGPASHVYNPEKVGTWLCGGTIQAVDYATWEIAYNHYANRLHLSMPQTAREIQRTRGVSTPNPNSTVLAWETLTHAQTGSVVVGVQPLRQWPAPVAAAYRARSPRTARSCSSPSPSPRGGHPRAPKQSRSRRRNVTRRGRASPLATARPARYARRSKSAAHRRRGHRGGT